MPSRFRLPSIDLVRCWRPEPTSPGASLKRNVPLVEMSTWSRRPLAPQGMEVTSVEYKINFLAAFQSGELRATGHVVRAGRRLIVTTADVIHVDANGKESACAVMQQTLMVVPKTY